MLLPIPIDPEVSERIARLDVHFNRYGIDSLGISRPYLAQFFTLLSIMYRRYFRVTTHDIQKVPAKGRAMLIGNHSGGIPMDAGMVLASLLLDLEPPRLAHAMVEKFAQTWPFVSNWFSRIGQLPGLPEHAARILKEDRLLMVFPEGARGTGKLYKDRYQLVRFGSGFVRLALQTQSPIIPFAFIGGEEAVPTIYHAKTLAKLIGAPYFPITPYLLPFPLPIACQIYYGDPMRFEGDGSEPDEIINGYVEQVKHRIELLIDRGRQERRVWVQEQKTVKQGGPS
jgi:1-acyl-sn-glycerol-3-phosphate acyltransferase